MTIIKAVRAWLLGCPLLSGDGVNVDHLPTNAMGYSVTVTPCTPVSKRFLDGSSLRVFEFAFVTRTFYGETDQQQLDNQGFFESLTAWIEEKASARELPTIDDDRTSRALDVTTSGYLMDNDTGAARYQIQCRLIYFQKGERAV